jgi:uncharacterized glyoxalase superfamily protein PhnB
MSDNTTLGLNYPTCSPYLFYEDGIAMMEFLCNAFGFKERMRHVDQDGSLRHGEVEYENAVIMLGSPPNFESPKRKGYYACGVYVHVPDADAHYERAKAAGADVDGPPQDQAYGVRSYGVLDPEGQQWWFAQLLT